MHYFSLFFLFFSIFHSTYCIKRSRSRFTDRTLSSVKNNATSFKEREIRDDEIIQLPVGRFPEPVCDYSVRKNDANGQPVAGALIGDALYHKWTCRTPGSDGSIYCIVVYNCTVANDRLTVPIIDTNGCTVEPQIVPDVDYPADLSGGIAAPAFSLGFGEPQIQFNCGIRLLIKEHGVCTRLKCPRH